ncbi:hypothetical protein [Nocardioides caldifontis]|uniref:hypothetical protein n=1 Tax=Nocardioides caldifontis TaxID=2588938 RepID=UPI0011E04F62|nr:hypothetical protein [Nocardioides caldifontis]
MTSSPDDERLVAIDDVDDEGLSTGTDDDAAVRDEELHAEEPLALDDENLRGDGPPEDITP